MITKQASFVEAKYYFPFFSLVLKYDQGLFLGDSHEQQKSNCPVKENTQDCCSVGSHRTVPVTLTLKDSHTLWNVRLIDRCLKRVTEVVDGDGASVAGQQACTSVLQEPRAFVCVCCVSSWLISFTHTHWLLCECSLHSESRHKAVGGAYWGAEWDMWLLKGQ